MKTLYTIALVACLWTLNACNQSTAQKEVATTEEAGITDQQKSALTATIDRFTKALVDADKTALEALTDASLSYGHSSGLIQDKPTFVDDVVNGGFDFLNVTIENQSINYQDCVAVVRHDFLSDATNNGEEARVQIGVLLLWKLDGDQWKLLARQAYKLQ